jgi:hypothetical protein
MYPRPGCLLTAIDLRDSFRDMVADRVYSLPPERVELLPIVLNGIMRKSVCFSLVVFSNNYLERCQEDDKRKARLRERIIDLRKANAKLQVENEGWIGNTHSLLIFRLINAG